VALFLARGGDVPDFLRNGTEPITHPGSAVLDGRTVGGARSGKPSSRSADLGMTRPGVSLSHRHA
jgi:hypothetical protein